MNAEYLLFLLETMIHDEIIATTEQKGSTLYLHFTDGTTRSVTVA